LSLESRLQRTMAHTPQWALIEAQKGPWPTHHKTIRTRYWPWSNYKTTL